jgi:hypothetical protein
MTYGIVIAVVGIILSVFGSDILVSFGATINQNTLFVIVGIVSKIWVAFGMPLAAGLICLSIAFTHIPGIGNKESKTG